MYNKKIFLSLILVTIIGLIIFWVWQLNSLPTPSSRLQAEKEIYSLLLMGESNDSLKEFPVGEYTTLGKFDEEISQKTIPLFVDGFPTIKRETFVDLKENNKQSYSIREYLPSPMNERLIGQQGWWISFSRIGFDSFLTQALVVKEEFFGCSSNGDCPYGRGSLLFLQKIDGKWVVQSELGFWRMEDA